MIYWAVVFFVIAMIAGLFGYTGVSGSTTEIAEIIFYLFLALFVASLVLLLIGRRKKRR